ncbi:response regulator [Hydrogenophaga sp.]|jgi:two-component system cell cycle response regulator CpdR|uniref:response regulator n=1 Tax=Hydrogenophaga sp. TaxID=1904254 RepID=UPI003F6EF864
MRILYVEDNRELRETIGMLMEADGHEVTACSTAEDALVLDAREPFDLLMSDAGLPGLSGTELARRLLAADPQRWVVLCSGYELGSYPQEWGPNVRTLLKPFELEDLEQLLSTVSAALDGGSAARTGF